MGYTAATDGHGDENGAGLSEDGSARSGSASGLLRAPRWRWFQWNAPPRGVCGRPVGGPVSVPHDEVKLQLVYRTEVKCVVNSLGNSGYSSDRDAKAASCA